MSSRLQRFSGDSLNFCLPQRQNSSPATPQYLIDFKKAQTSKASRKEEQHANSPRLVKGSFQINMPKRSHARMNPFSCGETRPSFHSGGGFSTSPGQKFSPRDLHKINNSKLGHTSSARRVLPFFEDYSIKATHQSQNAPQHMLSLILQKNSSQPTSPKTRREQQIHISKKPKKLQVVDHRARDGFIERWMIHRCQHASAKVSKKHQNKRADSKIRCVTRISFNSGQKPPYVLTQRKNQSRAQAPDLDNMFTDPGTDSVNLKERKNLESKRVEKRKIEFHKRGNSLANTREIRRSLIFRKLNFSRQKGAGADSALSQDLMSVCSGQVEKENKEQKKTYKQLVRNKVKETNECKIEKRAHSSVSRKENAGFSNLVTTNWKNRAGINQKLAT